jgi:hypothetical protein
MSAGIAVGKTTGWTAGVPFLARGKDFSLLHRVQKATMPNQPTIEWVMGNLSPASRMVGPTPPLPHMSS